MPLKRVVRKRGGNADKKRDGLAAELRGDESATFVDDRKMVNAMDHPAVRAVAEAMIYTIDLTAGDRYREILTRVSHLTRRASAHIPARAPERRRSYG